MKLIEGIRAMSFEIEYIEGCEYVRARHYGQSDLEEHRTSSRSAIEECRRLDAHRLLVDFREAETIMQTKEMFEFTKSLAGLIGDYEIRIAVIMREHDTIIDTGVAMVQFGNLALRNFLTEEDAIGWLTA